MSKLKVSPLPHSWPASDWPPSVFPNRTSAGKNLVRHHRDELIACGALCRVGRNLTVLGDGFAIFLASKMKRVADYEIAPNRSPSDQAAA